MSDDDLIGTDELRRRYDELLARHALPPIYLGRPIKVTLRNVCADTFPGHDAAAVVVRGWAYFGEQARVVVVAIPPTSQLAAKILDAPAGAYSIATDERLPRL